MSAFGNLPKFSFSSANTLHISELKAVLTSSALKSALFSVLTTAAITATLAIGDNLAAHADVVFASPIVAAGFAMLWNTIRGALNATKASADDPVKL